LNSNNSIVLWFTGLSGSGKTTISLALKKLLEKTGKNVDILDGDVVREMLHNNLGFSREDIRENNKKIAELAKNELENMILIYDYFNDVVELHKSGNKTATSLIESWANANWFLNKTPLPEELKITVFKVPGETNTDDLSPAEKALALQPWLDAKIDVNVSSLR